MSAKRRPVTRAQLPFVSRLGFLPAAMLTATLMLETAACHADALSATPSPTSRPPVLPSKADQGPRWDSLSPSQQTALKPLATEWDELDSGRKAKWLTLAKRFAVMTPDEQQRVQERMREWGKLTPQQRRTARENYARTKELPVGQKSERWEQYQQLPEEKKRELAAHTTPKKRVTRIPADMTNKGPSVPPVKSTPHPVLEQSVTPQVTNHSAFVLPASQ